jgi:hypothetical protein
MTATVTELLEMSSHDPHRFEGLAEGGWSWGILGLLTDILDELEEHLPDGVLSEILAQIAAFAEEHPGWPPAGLAGLSGLAECLRERLPEDILPRIIERFDEIAQGHGGWPSGAPAHLAEGMQRLEDLVSTGVLSDLLAALREHLLSHLESAAQGLTTSEAGGVSFEQNWDSPSWLKTAQDCFLFGDEQGGSEPPPGLHGNLAIESAAGGHFLCVGEENGNLCPAVGTPDNFLFFERPAPPSDLSVCAIAALATGRDALNLSHIDGVLQLFLDDALYNLEGVSIIEMLAQAGHAPPAAGAADPSGMEAAAGFDLQIPAKVLSGFDFIL